MLKFAALLVVLLALPTSVAWSQSDDGNLGIDQSPILGPAFQTPPKVRPAKGAVKRSRLRSAATRSLDQPSMSFRSVIAPDYRAEVAPPAASAPRSLGSSGIAAYLPAWNVPSSFVWLSPTDPSNWSLGAYGGVYNHGTLKNLIYQPWLASAAKYWGDGYMIAVNANYALLQFPYVPVDLDVDFSVADQFGNGNYGEVGLAPMLRWKWFPWNNYVYTTIACGPLGASYVTGISPLEASDTLHHHSSRYLNLNQFEWTFAAPSDPTWEAVLRVQHRSGIYGLIDHVTGGSNYVNIGVRKHF